MKATSARQNILKKIKQALDKPVPLPFEKSELNQTFFKKNKTDLEILFAENFSDLQGRFSFCNNEAELIQQLQTLFTARNWNSIFLNESQLKETLISQGLKISTETTLPDCDVSITSCEYLVARTGSILLSSIQSGRTASVYAPIHICIAYTNQL
ncbi:MAG: LUD domain-containing protein, partial [Parafilimonas sp.]